MGEFMVMKKIEFERLFRMIYGSDRKLVMTELWRHAGRGSWTIPIDAPVLCWRTMRGVGVIIGMANSAGVFDRDVKPAKFILTVAEYLSRKETSQTSQNFTRLHKVL